MMGDDDFGAPTPPQTLDEWETLLRRAFFTDRDDTAPFIFDLEVSEEIREWAGEEDLRARLAACVSVILDLESHADVFGPFRLKWRQWQVGSRTSVPPNLAVLAVTVAAATEMHHDRDAVSHAYFYRLAELLQPNATHAALLTLRDRLRTSFDPVRQWWVDLGNWVDANPQVGVNTIQGHPHFTRIGYPMSQAIVRRSDRMRLTRFFDKLDLIGLGVPTQDALITQLSLWAATPRGLSSTLVATLADPVRRPILGTYVHRLACSWNGVVLNPEGTAHLDIRLAIDLDDFASRWVIRSPSGAAHLEIEVNGQPVTLTRPGYGTVYDWHGPMPSVHAITGQTAVIAKGVGVSGMFDFPALQSLRANPDVGWLSEDDLEPYTPHILLVAPELHLQVEQVLEASARKGWRRINQKPGSQLVPGRVVYIKVEIEDAGAFKKALAEIDPSLARALRSPGGFRPRLVNGLGIFTNLGLKHYLRGGEPDLLLPVGDSPRSVTAALDHAAQEHPFHATGFPIPLRLVGPLDLGEHVLDVDEESIRFDIHEPDLVPTEPNSVLGWSRSGPTNELHEVEPATAGTTAIVGAVAAGELPEPYLLRRQGRQYYVIDRRGVFTPITPPPRNPLFIRIDIPESSRWEFFPSIEAIWLVERSSNEQFKVQSHRFIEPHFRQIDSASRTLWAQMLKQLLGSNPLLDMYFRAWERLADNAR